MKDYHVNVFYSDEAAAISLTFLIWSIVPLLAGTPFEALREVEKAKAAWWPPPKPRTSRFPSHATVRHLPTRAGMNAWFKMLPKEF